jgi:tight adherence protein B
MRERRRQEASESPLLKKDFSELAREAFNETAPTRRGLFEILGEISAQSGMHHMSAVRLLTIAAICGAVPLVLFLLLTASIVLALLAGALGAAMPVFFVQIKRYQRMEAMRAQIPDALDLMSRIIRAGQTMSQAMQAVSEEFKPPISTEIGYCYDQQNLGLPTELALRELARRTGLLEIKIFVLAMLVHRQTGGNLTGLLENLSKIVRDRTHMRAKISGLTAEGRLQALILLGLPFAMFGAMMVLNRPYAIKLFESPILIAGTLISMTFGAMWIRKIVNFDF